MKRSVAGKDNRRVKKLEQEKQHPGKIARRDAMKVSFKLDQLELHE